MNENQNVTPQRQYRNSYKLIAQRSKITFDAKMNSLSTDTIHSLLSLLIFISVDIFVFCKDIFHHKRNKIEPHRYM